MKLSINPILAEGEGFSIKESDLEERIPEATKSDSELTNRALDDLITKAMLEKEAEERGLLYAIDQSIADEEKEFQSSFASDADLQAYLDRHQTTLEELIDKKRDREIRKQVLTAMGIDPELSVPARRPSASFSKGSDRMIYYQELTIAKSSLPDLLPEGTELEGYMAYLQTRWQEDARFPNTLKKELRTQSKLVQFRNGMKPLSRMDQEMRVAASELSQHQVSSYYESDESIHLLKQRPSPQQQRQNRYYEAEKTRQANWKDVTDQLREKYEVEVFL
ncbi:MAG: hypothetical protein AAFY98_09600 [Verrucomicrobiota bacterium]